MSAEIPTSAATLEPADLREIHNKFASTPEGQNLSQQVRYDSYRPAHVSKEEWVELLGADASNLEHMPLTGVVARPSRIAVIASSVNCAAFAFCGEIAGFGRRACIQSIAACLSPLN